MNARRGTTVHPSFFFPDAEIERAQTELLRLNDLARQHGNTPPEVGESILNSIGSDVETEDVAQDTRLRRRTCRNGKSRAEHIDDFAFTG